MNLSSLHIYPIKACGTTVDQETAVGGQEPLRTLATYRRVNGEVMFGQKAVHLGQGRLRAGENVEVLANEGEKTR
ncbi:MAG: hypothetical protein ACREMO_00600 [Gemmatimonadales bacterium]